MYILHIYSFLNYELLQKPISPESTFMTDVKNIPRKVNALYIYYNNIYKL